jgi:phosphatidylethanolamine-binding protein (PEBP) family uncharacterized protein
MGTMKGTFIGLVAVGAVALAVMPASAAPLKVTVDSVKGGETIPNKYGFCMAGAQGRAAPGPDISPSVSWSKGPRGTKSPMSSS